MTNLKDLGILETKSAAVLTDKRAKRFPTASYFKVKPGSNTAPRLSTRIVKMPEGVLDESRDGSLTHMK